MSKGTVKWFNERKGFGRCNFCFCKYAFKKRRRELARKQKREEKVQLRKGEELRPEGKRTGRVCRVAADRSGIEIQTF